MTIYEKPKRPEDTTEYFVILTNHHQLREWVSWPPAPTFEMIKKLVEPLVDGYLEHVRVWHHGAYCSMFVDENGFAKNKARNDVATEIYRENWLKHHPGRDAEWLPHIVGDCVLFGRVLWLWQEGWPCR